MRRVRTACLRQAAAVRPPCGRAKVPAYPPAMPTKHALRRLVGRPGGYSQPMVVLSVLISSKPLRAVSRLLPP
jgi:hypothetical protein